MFYQDNELIIRPLQWDDLPRLWELAFKEEAPEWKKWDAPYYEHKAIPFDTFMEKADSYVARDNFWAIEIAGLVCGIVSYYWEHEPSKWLEMRIVFHEAPSWGKGLGTRALKLWIAHLFHTMPLVRVGYTTWSGNKRMIRVGEKLGMTMEARIRKVRFYNGQYYDSIRIGILREEWQSLRTVASTSMEIQK